MATKAVGLAFYPVGLGTFSPAVRPPGGLVERSRIFFPFVLIREIRGKNLFGSGLPRPGYSDLIFADI